MIGRKQQDSYTNLHNSLTLDRYIIVSHSELYDIMVDTPIRILQINPSRTETALITFGVLKTSPQLKLMLTTTMNPRQEGFLQLLINEVILQ